MASPTARTLQELRKRGYLADVVERFIAGARVRRDLFGIIDVLGLRVDSAVAPCGTPAELPCVHREGRPGLIGVQACVTGDLSKRVAKIVAAPAARIWLQNGLGLQVWGWSKKGAHGKRKTWELTIRAITLADLPAPLAADT